MPKVRSQEVSHRLTRLGWYDVGKACDVEKVMPLTGLTQLARPRFGGQGSKKSSLAGHVSFLSLEMKLYVLA